jgi:glutathione S-transferase
MSKLIYSSAGSPYARKVRIVLHEKGLPYEEDVRPGLRPVEELKGLNPNLALPVFIDQGETLFGSNLIIEYLLERHPGLPRASDATPFANRLTSQGDDRWRHLKILTTIESFADTMVNVRHFRTDGLRGDSSRYMARQEVRMNSCLDWLEEQATPHGFWPGTFSVMDISLICPLHYAETRGVIQWRNRPKLTALYDYWQTRPSVCATEESPLPAAANG